MARKLMIDTVSSVNDIRANNKELILNALSTVQTATKSEISMLTRLSLGTCNTLLNELAKEQRVIETEAEQPSSGRPPKIYRFNSDFSHILCLYITFEDNQRAITFERKNLLGERIEGETFLLDKLDIHVLVSVISSIIQNDGRINEISIGFPGYLSSGILVSCGIPELWGAKIRSTLQDNFHVKIHCMNDMNAAALGVYNELFPQMDDPFVLLGLFKNRCPGSGMIIHHLLLKGSTNFAGEVRHLVNYTDEIWEDIQKTRAQVVESLYVMLESFITVINPKVIALTGNNVRKDILDEVLDKIKSEIPEEHIPDFRIIPDIAPFYMNGLYNRSLDDID